MERFLAHIDGEREQTVCEHCEGTAKLSALFASAFDCGEQGYVLGLAHDIGKCSTAFQERLHGGKIVDHATAGAVECAKKNYPWALNCIVGHHGGLMDEGNIRTDQSDSPTLFGRIKRHLNDDYQRLWELPETNAPRGWGKSCLDDTFITRMLFSCLVDADFLDTERFMSAGKILRGGYQPLSKLVERLNAYIAPWQAPKNTLNTYRCAILQNCIDGAQKPRGLYTLTVPTGGGKTVASLAFALNHAVQHGLDRVIYVVPYTSIIEQNAEVFRQILGANQVIEHHSNVDADAKTDTQAERLRQAHASENWDAPLIVTTAVQFFESMYASGPSRCRKLHNIANSVIVFDEAQMLPTAHLRPCVAAIAKLVEHFQATAVLCTATQPVLGGLIKEYSPGLSSQELCENVPERFLQFRRVSFRRVGQLQKEQLCEALSAQDQVLCIVNSRKAAQEIYCLLPEEGSYHLSTRMYPAHRQRVLQEIRDRLQAGLPCRVVSTSLIEAGVDLDFPAVYRELAGLDSILQAAGRCNREGKRRPEESVVTIFESEYSAPLLLKTNIGAANEALQSCGDPSSPEAVEHYFRSYLSLSGTALDKHRTIDKLSEQSKKFKTAAESFHLIDSPTKTVYIPCGEGAELIGRLLAGELSRDLLRKLGRWAVNLYEPQYQSLLSAGALREIENISAAVLTDISRYSEKTGLDSTAEGSSAIFL